MKKITQMMMITIFQCDDVKGKIPCQAGRCIKYVESVDDKDNTEDDDTNI